MNSGDEAGVLAEPNALNTAITGETDSASDGTTPEQSGPTEESARDDSAVPNHWEQWAAEQTGGDRKPESEDVEPGDSGAPDLIGSVASGTRDSGDPRDSADSKGAPLWLASMVVLVVLLIAGVVVGGLFLSQVSANQSAASDRQAGLFAAKTAVIDLTTANYQNPSQYIAKLKPLAAGQFLNEFANGAKGFSTILSEGKVQTKGSVVNAGIASFGGTGEQVDVLAQETVTNSQTKNSSRYYRMEVTMIKSGSKWLVSNVKFVQ
jgi:Mce-associated membrane protein